MDKPRRPSILIKQLEASSSNDPKKSVNFYPHGTRRVYNESDAPTQLKTETIIKIKDRSHSTAIKSPTRLAFAKHTTKSPPDTDPFEIVHCICCLPLLVYISISNLFCPCIKHILSKIKAEWGSTKDGNCDEFIDLTFLPCNESFAVTSCGSPEDVKWLNIASIYGKQCELNFEGFNVKRMTDNPRDDHHKWLLSAVMNLCDYPYLIKKLFLQQRSSDECNKFRIKLYDGVAKKWKQIVIDDMIPCNGKSNKPIFHEVNVNQHWFLLLEKSMAKLCGSYEDLSSGDIPWALQTLTGRKVKVYLNTTNQKRETWTEGCIKYTKKKQHRLYFDDDAAKYFNHKHLWHLLNKVYNTGGLIVAARAVDHVFEKISEMNAIDIVSDESYSVAQMRQIGGFNLIQVHNRWNYKSDKTYRWRTHPQVMEILKAELDCQGKFWIELNDFVSVFNVVCVCNRVIQMDDAKKDIVLDVESNATISQTSSVCCKKCFSFWCKCVSCKIVYPTLCKNNKQNTYISTETCPI
eukprot:362631_1